MFIYVTRPSFYIFILCLILYYFTALLKKQLSVTSTECGRKDILKNWNLNDVLFLTCVRRSWTTLRQRRAWPRRQPSHSCPVSWSWSTCWCSRAPSTSARLRLRRTCPLVAWCVSASDLVRSWGIFPVVVVSSQWGYCTNYSIFMWCFWEGKCIYLPGTLGNWWARKYHDCILFTHSNNSSNPWKACVCSAKLINLGGLC